MVSICLMLSIISLNELFLELLLLLILLLLHTLPLIGKDIFFIILIVKDL